MNSGENGSTASDDQQAMGRWGLWSAYLYSHRQHRSSLPRFRLSSARPLFRAPKANPRPAYADRGFGV